MHFWQVLCGGCFSLSGGVYANDFRLVGDLVLLGGRGSGIACARQRFGQAAGGRSLPDGTTLPGRFHRCRRLGRPVRFPRRGTDTDPFIGLCQSVDRCCRTAPDERHPLSDAQRKPAVTGHCFREPMGAGPERITIQGAGHSAEKSGAGGTSEYGRSARSVG